jgi:hypothetical protein
MPVDETNEMLRAMNQRRVLKMAMVGPEPFEQGEAGRGRSAGPHAGAAGQERAGAVCPECGAGGPEGEEAPSVFIAGVDPLLGIIYQYHRPATAAEAIDNPYRAQNAEATAAFVEASTAEPRARRQPFVHDERSLAVRARVVAEQAAERAEADAEGAEMEAQWEEGRHEQDAHDEWAMYVARQQPIGQLGRKPER